MGSFAPILPELILSIGGTVLMMVAAFTGRRGAGLTSWLAVALLLGATAALVGAPSHAGPIFDGIITADLFGAFGKAIMFPAAAVAIIAAHGWFERETEHGAEYAVLIVFAAVGTCGRAEIAVDDRRPTQGKRAPKRRPFRLPASSV